MADPFRLERFIQAQDAYISDALRELHAGRKRTHWMWFVFPQLRGLGSSSMAEFYSLASLEEAKAYLEDPVLGETLKLCTQAVLAHRGTSLTSIFGSPDDLKFRSSMTLFARAAPQDAIFRDALQHLCAGQEDQRTLELLNQATGSDETRPNGSD